MFRSEVRTPHPPATIAKLIATVVAFTPNIVTAVAPIAVDPVKEIAPPIPPVVTVAAGVIKYKATAAAIAAKHTAQLLFQ